jgi:prepilin-type N-terminal cleavage/methylation domain-containing protein
MNLNINIKLKRDKGVTLIELLIALVISGILIAALYRIFIGQQKTYTVLEQVADMKQNVRVAVSKMMREIRMVGLGNVSDVLGLAGGVNGFTQAITPNNNSITIVGGFRQVSTLAADAAGGQNQVTLTSATDAAQFDTDKHRFISIGGTESNTVTSINGAVLTLNNPLKRTHKITDRWGNLLSERERPPILKIQAITYTCGVSGGKPALRRDENTGGGAQPLAENIENIEFVYFDSSDNPTANPSDIRKIRVTVKARTDMSDPDYKSGDGYRRREIMSNIQLRNIGLAPL